MTDRIDAVLSRLPEPMLDHALDQLEPRVWARIEQRRSAGWTPGLRFQLAAAAVALMVGLAIGWSNTGAAQQSNSEESRLYAAYVETGPMARLEAGL